MVFKRIAFVFILIKPSGNDTNTFPLNVPSLYFPEGVKDRAGKINKKKYGTTYKLTVSGMKKISRLEIYI